MEDKINKYNNNPDYDAGYQEGWENAINYVIDISKHMRYTRMVKQQRKSKQSVWHR